MGPKARRLLIETDSQSYQVMEFEQPDFDPVHGDLRRVCGAVIGQMDNRCVWAGEVHRTGGIFPMFMGMSTLSTTGMVRPATAGAKADARADQCSARKVHGGSGPTTREFYIGLAVLTVCAGIAMTRGGPEPGFAATKDQAHTAKPAAYPAVSPADARPTENKPQQADQRPTLPHAVSSASQ